MVTNMDILRHRIRNKDLLELIEKYTKEYPREPSQQIYSERLIHTLPYIIHNSFNYTKTKEGNKFWSSFTGSIPFNENFYIDQWKHIDEWLQDEKAPETLKKHKNEITEQISTKTNIERKLLYYHGFRNIIHAMWCYHTPIYEHITEGKDILWPFYNRHNRFPNDFDL